jgi:type IV pilus biogenesis protein PilP
VVTSTEDLSATPDIAAMIATMSTKAPTVATLAEVARREREIALAERYAKIKAATAPRVPVDAVPQVKVIKPVVRQPLVAPEAPLKHVLAIYGAPGREEADLLLADGSIQTVQRGTRGEGFEVLSVSRDAVRVSVSRQVVAKGSGHKGRGRDELKTVRSTLDVPVGTAFH